MLRNERQVVPRFNPNVAINPDGPDQVVRLTYVRANATLYQAEQTAILDSTVTY